MKKLLVMMFIVTTVVATFAAGNPSPVKKAGLALAEENYITGIKTENEGLQVSSAYYLGEMKSEKAVIPLMALLHNSEHKSVRIAAALSLLKIGDERGIYAIYKNIRFDDSECVRCMCRRFYVSHIKETLE